MAGPPRSMPARRRAAPRRALASFTGLALITKRGPVMFRVFRCRTERFGSSQVVARDRVSLFSGH